jgi:hypothetical protein
MKTAIEEGNDIIDKRSMMNRMGSRRESLIRSRKTASNSNLAAAVEPPTTTKENSSAVNGSTPAFPQLKWTNEIIIYSQNTIESIINSFDFTSNQANSIQISLLTQFLDCFSGKLTGILCYRQLCFVCFSVFSVVFEVH